MYTVYILYSHAADRYYIGKTADFEVRLQQHRDGASTFTSRANDWEPVFRVEVNTPSEADQLERKIKRSKSRKSILRYISGTDNLCAGSRPPEP